MDEHRASLTGKRFVLGLGAQKAGTSWLYHYLTAHQNVRLGRHKEYRIWDAIDLPLFRRYKIPLNPAAIRRDPLRFVMQRVPGFYFAYFAKLLAPSHVTVSADISPSYAGLDHGRLSMIRRGFSRRGIDSCLVFLMREPVERCASLVGMWRKRTMNGEKPPDSAFLDLYDYCRTDHARTLTAYDFTLEQIEASFGPESTYYGLYEEMFSDEKISAVSGFLGVAPNPAKREERVNASAGAAPSLTDADFAALAPAYRSAYEAAAARLPQAVQLWRGFKYL